MGRGLNSLFVLILLANIFLLNFSSSEVVDSVGDQLDSVAERAENISDTVDSIVNDPLKTRDELRREYLKVEWNKILKSKPVIGEIITTYEKVSPYTDPILEYAVGLTPSFSWYFLLILVIWIVLVKYFYTFYEVLRDFSSFSNTTSVLVSTCFFIILLVLHFFQKIAIFAADKVISFIGLLDSTFIQVILVIIGILVFIILGKFSKEIKVLARYIRIQKYKYKKDQEEQERIMRLEAATRKAEAVADALIK